MPTEADQASAAEHTGDRLFLVFRLEDHGRTSRRLQMKGASPEIACLRNARGPPDLAVNPLAEMALQTVVLSGMRRARPLITPAVLCAGHCGTGADGLLVAHVARQYFARGVGSAVSRLEWIDGGSSVAARIVTPNNVFVTHPDDPMRATGGGWGQLRVREVQSPQKSASTPWDVFDISDPKNPTFKVIEAMYSVDGEKVFGADMTETFIPDAEQRKYRWVKDGVPYIPAVTYHSVWSGMFWNPSIMRGVYHGTLNAITFSTFTAHSAHAAVGPPCSSPAWCRCGRASTSRPNRASLSIPW